MGFFSPTLFSIAVAIVAAPLRPLFNQQERDHCRYSQVRITRRKMVCNTFVTDTSFFFLPDDDNISPIYDSLLQWSKYLGSPFLPQYPAMTFGPAFIMFSPGRGLWGRVHLFFFFTVVYTPDE